MPGDPVETHYTRPDLGGIILAALRRAGKDIDRLTPDDLAPVDEFHGGQRPATIRLAELADLRDRVSRLEGMLAAAMVQPRAASPTRARRRLLGPSDQVG